MNDSINQKRPSSTESMMGILASRMSAAPNSMFIPATMRGFESRINERTGLVNQERLMHAVMYRLRNQAPSDNFDLSSPENVRLLNAMTRYVLNKSEPGESIERMSDKVVVMFTVMHEIPGLDQNKLILAVNDVFMHWGQYDDVGSAITRTMRRMQPLENKRNKAAESAWLKDEWGVGDGNFRRYYEGGFYKKTKCRKNKMRKSRKSRSRR
jgi:hypothetical protein